MHLEGMRVYSVYLHAGASRGLERRKLQLGWSASLHRRNFSNINLSREHFLSKRTLNKSRKLSKRVRIAAFISKLI